MQSSQNQQFNKSVFNLNQAFDALATDHYAVIPQFLTSTMREALLAELLQLQAQGLFHEASVGRGVGQTRQAHIRGDSICWLEDHFTIGGQYLALMEQLRQQLNADFYLGYALMRHIMPIIRLVVFINVTLIGIGIIMRG